MQKPIIFLFVILISLSCSADDYDVEGAVDCLSGKTMSSIKKIHSYEILAEKTMEEVVYDFFMKDYFELKNFQISRESSGMPELGENMNPKLYKNLACLFGHYSQGDKIFKFFKNQSDNYSIFAEGYIIVRGSNAKAVGYLTLKIE